MKNPSSLVVGQLSIAPADLARDADRLLKLLRESEAPKEIVRLLGSPDMLLLLRRADDAEREDLFLLASPEQVRELVDLACWKRDRFDGRVLEELLRPLVSSGPDGAAKALDEIDDEVRFLLLRRHAIVHLREDRNDEILVPDESEIIESPDGSYLVELPEPETTPEGIRQLFQALFRRSFVEYQPELEALRHELPSETEERAFGFRQGRMADLGFGTREEGLALLSPREPSAVRRIAEDGGPVPPVPDDLSLPALYRGGLAGNALLDAALSRIRELADRQGALDERRFRRALALDAELGAMTSLLLSAVECDLGDPEEIARRVCWARDLLALGLESVFEGDAERAAAGLLSQAPGLFVQAAMGVLEPLRRRSRALLADPRLVAGGRRCGLLDPPHQVAVETAALELPSRWPPLDEGMDLSCAPLEPLPWEIAPFADRGQVRRAVRLIEEAEAVARELTGRQGWQPVGDGEASASRLVINALCQASLGREPRPAPLSAKAAGRFTAEILAAAEDDLLRDALAALGPVLGCGGASGPSPLEDDDPTLRMLTRLVLIGRARLAGGEPLHGARL
ncbi:MAG TPA: DUF6178 family protein [Polyangia bacterium]|nr:DUF6178 family protein [Polyangia bacterium]